MPRRSTVGERTLTLNRAESVTLRLDNMLDVNYSRVSDLFRAWDTYGDGITGGAPSTGAGDPGACIPSASAAAECQAAPGRALTAAGVEAPDALCRTLDALSPGKKKAAAGVTSLRVMEKMSLGKLRESRREALAALKLNKPA